MLPLLRVNPWDVTKPRFIQCLLGGRKAPHSKALHSEWFALRSRGSWDSERYWHLLYAGNTCLGILSLVRRFACRCHVHVTHHDYTSLRGGFYRLLSILSGTDDAKRSFQYCNSACQPCVALLISPTGFIPLRLSHLSNPPLCQCCVPDNPNTMRLHEQVRTLRKNVLPPLSREKDGGIITIRTTFAPNRRPSYVECVWNLMAHGDAQEGKWRGNWRMEWVASTLTPPRNVVYPALLALMRTPRLPAVD